MIEIPKCMGRVKIFINGQEYKLVSHDNNLPKFLERIQNFFSNICAVECPEIIDQPTAEDIANEAYSTQEGVTV